MLKKLLIAPFAALVVAGAAHAAPLQTLTLHNDSQVNDQGLRSIFGVESHRSVAAVIATDALYGGLAGLAIGAGVALLEGGNNWGRDLSVGAGAGLLIGGIFGAIDAASMADSSYHDRGFNRAAGLGGHF
jgi:hypothetical protein